MLDKPKQLGSNLSIARSIRQIRPRELSLFSVGLTLSAILLAEVFLIGCGEPYAEKGEDDKPATTQSPVPKFTKTETSGLYGAVESYVLGKKALDEKAQSLSASSLIKLDLPPELGVNAYTVSPVGESPIVLSPKLMLKNAQLGGGFQIKQEGEGISTIYLSIALVNGLEREILGPNGLTPIPDALLVKNKMALIKEVEAKTKYAPEFTSMVQCPTQMVLSTLGGEDVPVQFRTPLRNCPFNQFFPVEFKMSTENWERLMHSIAQGNAISVAFDLDLRVPVLTGFHQFRIKKEVLRNQILEGLRSNSSGDIAVTPLEKLNPIIDLAIQRLQEDLGTSIKEESFFRFKSKLIHEYFRELSGSDCAVGQSKCYLQKIPKLSSGEFQVRIISYEYFGNPIHVHSSTTIGSFLNDLTPFTVKSYAGTPLQPPASGELNNLSMTTYEGQILEFDFRILRKNVLEWVNPKVQFFENQQCTSFGPIPTREEDDPSQCLEWFQDCNLWNNCNAWVDQCVEWEAWCCRSSGRGGESCGHKRYKDPYKKPEWFDCSGEHCAITNRHCAQPVHECVPGHWFNTNVCKKYGKRRVPIGEAPCLKKENQWHRVTTFSVPGASSTWFEREFLDQQMKPLMEGLLLHFDLPSPEGAKSLDCRLTDMDYRIVPGHRVLIIFKNTEKCKPFGEFTRLPGHGPSISFINQFSEPSEFQCGELNENWLGNRTWTCRLPDGTVKSLESTVSGDEKLNKEGGRCGIYQPYFPRTEIFGFSREIGVILIDRRGL